MIHNIVKSATSGLLYVLVELMQKCCIHCYSLNDIFMPLFVFKSV